ncbi:MAG: GvpL/GvpF family gas vesicle protein [Anaerolineae bacterium]
MQAGEMVLNGAYLVDETELEAFRTVLATLEPTYADQGFEYELTGPWPPYNFAALELAES